MALWKTSTAGSARSTSTSSNRRQACLKAALRGGFLISSPLPAQTARYRSTQLATASPHGLRYALAWRRSVRNRKKTNTDAMQFRTVWMEKAAFEIRKRVRVCPRRMPHLFILETLPRKAHANTKPPNEITPSLMPRSFVYSSNASKSMRQSEDRATKKEPPRRVAL